MNERGSKKYGRPTIERFGQLSDLTASGSPFVVPEGASNSKNKQRP